MIVWNGDNILDSYSLNGVVSGGRVPCYRTVTLLEIMRLQAEIYLNIIRTLDILMPAFNGTQKVPIPSGPIGSAHLEMIERELNLYNNLYWIKRQCEKAALPSAPDQVDRAINIISNGAPTFLQIHNSLIALQERIHDDFKNTVLIRIPAERASYYMATSLFGQEVADKFPLAANDIEEAGKCLALGRYTACVFHLMRVMEIGVKFLGRKMQVPLTDEKTWDAILRDLNTKIKGITSGSSGGKLTGRKKAKRDKYAAAVAHLTHVKDAWRNRVAHPKDSYTDEQAEEVFRFVKTYMRYLAKEF